MTRIIVDVGNAYTKWFIPRTAIEGDFPSSIAELTSAEWQRAVGTGKPRQGLVKVNGIPYAVGNAARRHILKERPQGAARYHSGYYGVALSYVFSQAFVDSDSISLFASHAPQDVSYANDLISTAERVWCVESERGIQRFEVRDVTTFDEPIGGYAHYAFDKRGKERPGVDGKTALVIDVGGYTTDKAIIDPDGSVDMLTIGSTRTGTIQVFEQFEAELRRNNASKFKDAGDLDIRRLEAAIISGAFPFGRIQINCQQEADESIRSLVNDVIQIIRTAGGAAAFDVILLTGGGSALIYDHLTAAFPDIEFVLVEQNRDMLRFATVYGGAKIATLMGKGEL